MRGIWKSSHDITLLRDVFHTAIRFSQSGQRVKHLQFGLAWFQTMTFQVWDHDVHSVCKPAWDCEKYIPKFPLSLKGYDRPERYIRDANQLIFWFTTPNHEFAESKNFWNSAHRFKAEKSTRSTCSVLQSSHTTKLDDGWPESGEVILKDNKLQRCKQRKREREREKKKKKTDEDDEDGEDEDDEEGKDEDDEDDEADEADEDHINDIKTNAAENF